MKPARALLFPAIPLLLLAGVPLPAPAQQTYPPDTAWFKNPERGFFEWVTSHRTSADSTGQGFWRLIAGGPDSVSLVFEEFVLRDFKTSLISQAYLDMMQAEFNNVRKFGMKAVVRFSYISSPELRLTPPDTVGTDTTWMKTHIRQVEPVIRRNADVIAFFQAGYIGRWGEWGGGAGSAGVAHPDYSRDTAAQAALLRSLLSMLPASRMVDVRAPRYKLWYLREDNPMSVDDWLSGTDRGRIGQHNDAFHVNYVNSGTFYDYDIHDTSYFRPWYRTETQFGGITAEQSAEWNGPYDPAWFTDLDGWYRSFVLPVGRENAEMANQHVASIQLLQSAWSAEMKTRGFWNTVRRRLGYRLQLIDAEFPPAASPGEPFRLRVRITNTGWASLRNPRGLELVLRHDSTGEETVLGLFRHKHPALDPRLWWPGDTVQIDTTCILPGGLTSGTHSILLNLPDTCALLAGRPAYSIRLANQGVWQPLTGRNDLGARIVIGETPVTAAGASGAPLEFAVEQNYPNPFNSSTVIRYAVPYEAHVTVELFNTIGQKVRTLVDGVQTAGRYAVHWSGENDAGIAAGSGIFLYRVRAGDRSAVRKMVLTH